MKKKTGVFIIVFLAVMVTGAIRPAALYCAETGGGAPWDFLVDTTSFTGTKYFGPLSVYFEFLTGKNSLCPNYANQPDPANPKAWYYFVVRLNRGGTNYYSYFKPSTPLCYQALDKQGAAVEQLIDALIQQIYNYPDPPKVWKLKSFANDDYVLGLDGKAGAFVGDITIAVKE